MSYRREREIRLDAEFLDFDIDAVGAYHLKQLSTEVGLSGITVSRFFHEQDGFPETINALCLSLHISAWYQVFTV